MFNFNKDDKVFIIETRDGEIKRAEWTEVERTYVDSSGWNCETVIVLKNNVTMFGSQGDNSRVQRNIADKVLANQIVGGSFSFLSKSKEDCIEYSTRFLAGETAFLNGDIVKLQIRIEKINETIDKIKEL